ncbi:MAG: DUF4398 domain-containing protein [Pseudomonadota bacterium]|jgi:hypothetical protein
MTARALILAAVLACGVGGCAGGSGQRPVEQLTRAGTMIDQAEQAGAQRFAAAELEQAREKLQRAQQAANENDNEVARRLAVEAALDAELATARAASADAERSAEEVRQGVDTLRRESERSTMQSDSSTTGNEAPGAPPATTRPESPDSTNPGTQVPGTAPGPQP